MNRHRRGTTLRSARLAASPRLLMCLSTCIAFVCILFSPALGAKSLPTDPRPTTTVKSAAGQAQAAGIFAQFDIDIPGITDAMLESKFWLDRTPDLDKLIMYADEIGRYNRKSLRECETLKDLRVYPRLLAGTEVRTLIEKLSQRPKKTKYRDGKAVDAAYYEGLEQNLNLAGIPEVAHVRFGITAKRTEMRTFPTTDRVFDEPADYEFDRFMETALYPVEPLAILHESSDGKWLLAQAYNYLGWVAASDVAQADRAALFEVLDGRNFLVVTGKRVFTGFNPHEPDISELQLDMGVRVPLADRREIPREINGQHPAGNYVVKLPIRNKQGQLEWRFGLVSRADEVHIGYLPLTRRNIITQAFKFIGQRYGWGGMFNTRDCSAFIMDNFRSMGIMLPRNAGEQGKQALGATHVIPETMSLEERKQLFDRLPPAIPVYMAGHAMLYLGKYQDDYYIIHDFAGFTTIDASGQVKKAKTRGVLVTPLLAVMVSKDKKWMEALYSAREFTLDPRDLSRPPELKPRPPRVDSVRMPRRAGRLPKGTPGGTK